MATAAKLTYGTLFKQGSTTIAEVTSIGDVGPQAEMIEVTNLDSPNGYREYIYGLLDGEEFQIEMNFLPGNSTHQGLRTNCTGKVTATYSIVWSGSGETWTFSANVTSFKARGGAPGEVLKATVAFKLTGSITVT